LYLTASKRPTILVRDVTRKYEGRAVFPAAVVLTEVSRACFLYDVPPIYRALLPQIPIGSESEYKDIFDPRRPNFDAAACLKEKRLLVSVQHARPLDYIVKCKVAFIDKLLPQAINSRRRDQRQQQSIEEGSQLHAHLLDQIAALAVSGKGIPNNSFDTPMQLLDNLMKTHGRVRVIIRKLNGLRGFLEGELICFDKHFNMVLRNAVEKYSLSQDMGKEVEPSKSHNTTHTTTQHISINSSCPNVSRRLPLLLVRGDNVVLVSKILS
jgi:small nuclear ribonucleoprotein (snRNP)-like protein